jgi:Predicted permeases
MNFIDIIRSILPIALLIIAGNVMNRIGFVEQKVIDGMKRLVTDVTLPCLLFMAFFNMTFNVQYSVICIAIFCICFVAFGVGLALKKGFNVKNKYFATIFASFETGNIGYAIFTAVFGNDNIYMIAISDLGHIIFTVVFFYVYIKQLNGEKKQTAKDTLHSIVTMPIAIMTVLGLMISVFGLNSTLSSNFLTGAVVNTIERLSNVTVPVICLAVGYELKIDWKNIKIPCGLALVRLAMNLCLAFLLNKFIVVGMLNLDKVFQMAVYTMFILPPTFCVPAFIDDKGSGEKQLILNTISVHLFLTLIMYIVISLLMGF